jgi:hypothetical protein
MKAKEVLEENIMQYPETITALDQLVRFTIAPLFDDLALTKKEIKQASQFIQNRLMTMADSKR